MDSTNTLPQIETAQAQKEATANELFAGASPAMFAARNAVTSVGLTWGYLGGRYGGNLVANGTETLDASDTTYMVADLSTGAISFDTATTDWDDDANYGRCYAITTNGTQVTSWEDHRLGPLGILAGGGTSAPNPTECIVVCVSDEATALTTGAGKVTFRMPYAFTLSAVRASVTTAPTGAALQVDINESGASILSTVLSIDASEKTSTTAATPAVISDTALADDAEIKIDIDQVGSSVAGAGLKVYLIGAQP